jgi:pimeloyl-ACP methyl ester carboxylesterase
MLPARRSFQASLPARLALLAAPLALGACMALRQGSTVQSTPAALPDTGGLVLVLAGGFNSCGYNKVKVAGEADEDWSPYGLAMLPNFNQLTRDILKDRPTAPLRWVISCFGTSQDHLRYYTSSHPKPSELRKVDHLHEADLVADILEEARQAGPDPTVVVIGHSWGGSLAMHVTRSLATAPGADRIKELGVVTLDPISRLTPNLGCNPSTFFKILTQPFSDTQTRCRQAPVYFAYDMDKDTESAAVARRADIVKGVTEMFWLNYYQNNFRFLHSSLVGEASMNAQKVMKTFLNPVAAHTDIALRAEIWTEIKARTMARFGATPPAAAVLAPAFAAPVGRDAEETRQLDLNDRLRKALAELARFRATEQEVAERGFRLEFAGDTRDPSKPVLVVTMAFRDQATLDASAAAIATVRKNVDDIAAQARQRYTNEAGVEVPGPLEGIGVLVTARVDATSEAARVAAAPVRAPVEVGGPERPVAPQAADAAAGVVFAAPVNEEAPSSHDWVEAPGR